MKGSLYACKLGAHFHRTGLLSQIDFSNIAQRLAELRLEHRDLDDVIARMLSQPFGDDLQIRRLKKRKLRLKDMIAKLQSQLIPDLDA